MRYNNKMFAALTVLIFVCSFFALNGTAFAAETLEEDTVAATDAAAVEKTEDVITDAESVVPIDGELELEAPDGNEKLPENEQNDKVMEFKICVPEFVDSLKVMLMGMLGIFAVTGVIILCICVLNKLTKSGE